MKGDELVNYVHHRQEEPERKIVGYINPLTGTYKTVEQVEAERSMAQQEAFNKFANVFNTAKQAMTFVAAHRPGHVVVKVGRKYVPATPEFAKRMGLKIITNNGGVK